MASQYRQQVVLRERNYEAPRSSPSEAGRKRPTLGDRCGSAALSFETIWAVGGHQWSSDLANSRSGSSRSSVKFVTPPKVEISGSKLIELDVIIQGAGPPVRHPSRRLRAIPRDNLLGQIDEGAQARSHVAASWIIEAISGIPGRPLV